MVPMATFRIEGLELCLTLVKFTTISLQGKGRGEREEVDIQ